jgi:NAD+ synthase
MTDTLQIALAQMNPTVGDVDGNVRRLREVRRRAAEAGADLVVATELVITGYPPEDLVTRPAFLDAVDAAVASLAADTADGGPALLIGAPRRDDGKLYNAALLLEGGKVASVRFKYDLPNYGPFDEKRVFAAGPMPGPMSFRGVRLGAMVCEDMWTADVSECLEESGAELLVVINGSPFDVDKPDVRLNLAVARVNETHLPLIYVNQVGGQDELVFDGASFVLNGDCALAAQARSWREELVITRWTRNADALHCETGERTAPPGRLAAIYEAMTTGLRDYVRKNGFPGVIVGLSGGIDSALTAAVAADALGPDRVRCVMMPSPFTSRDSLEDASEVARLIGVRLDSISIEPAMEAFETMLRPAFGNLPADTTEENIQARARGMTLMALSNKTGAMVLSTGNKSEMSVGYATLYGDMCGGYSVLKDVYKMAVFELARWRNAQRPEGALGPAGRVMPDRVITKPPTAELKPNQTDQDTLPPYALLDAILERLVERDMGVKAIAAEGYDEAVVSRVWRMLTIAEYKRRQAPPGVKITSRSFGRDRRYPITNAFKDPQ